MHIPYNHFFVAGPFDGFPILFRNQIITRDQYLWKPIYQLLLKAVTFTNQLRGLIYHFPKKPFRDRLKNGFWVKSVSEP